MSKQRSSISSLPASSYIFIAAGLINIVGIIVSQTEKMRSKN